MARRTLWITQWKRGIDRREGRRVANANTIYDLVNADVTTGYAIRRRAGHRPLGTLPPETAGAASFAGAIHTFSAAEPPTVDTVEELQVVNNVLTYSARELVRVGDFASDDLIWERETGWTIGSGVATVTGGRSVDADLKQRIHINPGIEYHIEFTTSASSGGGETLTVYLGGELVGSVAGGVNGLQSFDTVAGGEDQYLRFVASDGIAVSIDGVTVKSNADPNTVTIIDVNPVVFNGKLYVAAKYSDLSVIHHYINGNPDPTTGYQVTDTWCPHTFEIMVLANKMWAVDFDVVRFSNTDDPTVWEESAPTTPDAGYLPTGTRAPGSELALSLGEYQGKLVVFHEDSLQVWAVDPDPAQHALEIVIGNLGCRFPGSVRTLTNDMIFLTSAGYRSLRQQLYTETLETNDVGTPIDDLVPPVLVDVDTGLPIENEEPKGGYFAGNGQYLCAIGRQVHAFKASQSSKLYAWSRYSLPFDVQAYTSMGESLYVRAGNSLYKFDPDYELDGDSPFGIEGDLGFENAKSPTATKMWHGADFAMDGTIHVEYLFDPRDPDMGTSPMEVVGDTRPGAMYPCGVMSTEMALRFTASSDEFRQLDGIALHYDMTAH